MGKDIGKTLKCKLRVTECDGYISFIDTEALSNTKCYICVYSEKNGIIMPGGTEKCIDPFGDKQTRDIGVDECRGMCYVCQVILIRSSLS